MYFFLYSYCVFIYLHRASWHFSATLNEVFPWFSSVVRQMPSKIRKDGTRPALLQIFVLFSVLFVLCRSVFFLMCKCVVYYCHRVDTQLQLIDI